MSTVLSLLSRSLRIVRVVDVNDVPEEADIATALTALNAMMRRWEANGLALGWTDALKADDEAPLPAEAEEPVVYNLAVRLRPEYGTSIDPDVVAMARDGLAILRRDRIVASPIEYANCRGAYDTRTDSYC